MNTRYPEYAYGLGVHACSIAHNPRSLAQKLYEYCLRHGLCLTLSYLSLAKRKRKKIPLTSKWIDKYTIAYGSILQH
jgi:hypothetical protein